MSHGMKVSIVVVLAAGIAAACWAEATRTVTVPVSGEYYERAAGGVLRYDGVLTLTWLMDAYAPGEWPVKGTLVAQAWCVNTGAGYMLYGCCGDCVQGTRGGSCEVAKTILAINGQGLPAFEGRLLVGLAIDDVVNPPAVTAAVLASR